MESKLIVPYDKIRLINLNIVKIFSDLIISGIQQTWFNLEINNYRELLVDFVEEEKKAVEQLQNS